MSKKFMDDIKWARDSEFWRSLVNAVAMEMGIAPVIDRRDMEFENRHTLEKVPSDEQRAMARKFRKLKRKVIKHANSTRAKSNLRCNSVVKNVILDLIERACVEAFPGTAQCFDDTNGNMKDVQEWRRHGNFLDDQDYELLMKACREATARLTKGRTR